MLEHKLVKWMLPTYLSNIGKTKSNHLIIQSIKFGVSIHLTNGCSSKHHNAKELLGTLVITKYASGRKVAKNLGLDRQCIYQILQRCFFIYWWQFARFIVWVKKVGRDKCTFPRSKTIYCGLVDPWNNCVSWL
jgi:hypothetical protein